MTDGLLDQKAADLIDNQSPANQQGQVGERIKEMQATGLIIQKVVVDAAANVTAKSFTVDYDMELIRVVFHNTAGAVTNATARLRSGTTAITDAVITAVANDANATTKIAQDEKVLAAGDVLNIITNGANDRCEAYLIGIRI
jgi:CMP-2-keto-3-deoxyoctulosonic acid synthetase